MSCVALYLEIPRTEIPTGIHGIWNPSRKRTESNRQRNQRTLGIAHVSTSLNLGVEALFDTEHRTLCPRTQRAMHIISQHEFSENRNAESRQFPHQTPAPQERKQFQPGCSEMRHGQKPTIITPASSRTSWLQISAKETVNRQFCHNKGFKTTS